MVWVAVICDDCLINYISSMLVCFCLVVSFVSFFGPLVLQISPLLKLLVSRHRTRRVSQKCIYLETQLNRMEFSADCSEIGNSSSEYKRNPGWNVSIKFALTCTPHNNMEFSADYIQIGGYLIMLLSVKSPSACTPHSRNDQISKKINCVQGWQNIIKGMAQIQV